MRLFVYTFIMSAVNIGQSVLSCCSNSFSYNLKSFEIIGEEQEDVEEVITEM